MKQIVFLFSFALFAHSILAQPDLQHKTDSLHKLAASTKIDTIRAAAFMAISELYFGNSIDSMHANADKAFDAAEKGLKIAEGKTKRKLLSLKAEALNNLGYVYSNTSNIAKGLDYYKRALKIREEIDDKHGIANSLNNIGIVYDEAGDVGKALDAYLRCLKILEETPGEDEKYGMGFILNNLAFIYSNQGDYSKAQQYFERSLKLRKEINDVKGIAQTSMNIGTMLLREEKHEEALKNFEAALKIFEGAGYKRGVADCLTDIGRVYLEKGDMSKAKEQLNKALELSMETKDKGQISNNFIALADVYLRSNDLNAALYNANKSMELARQLERPESVRGVAEVLHKIYVKKGDYRNAYEMFQLYVKMKDSILSAQNQKAAVQKEMQYVYEKKTSADSVRNAEQIKLEELKHEQEISKQRSYTYGGIIGFILMLLLAGISFRAFRIKRRANEEIAEQKLLVENKQKEIIDSITYAKRIQQSHMPTEKYIDQTIRRLNS